MMGPLFPITSLKTRVETLEGANYEFTFWREVSTATGTITKPLGSTILLDRWPADVDAVVSIVTTGEVPDEEHAYTAAGEIISTTLTAAGAFVLSGTPSSYPVAIVARASCPAASWKAMIDSGEILLGFAKIDDGTSGINYANPIAANSTGTITPVDGAYYTSTSKHVTLVSVNVERFCPVSKLDTGTTDGTTSSKLVDSTQDFDVDGTEVGDVVLNTTDSTRAEITAIDSATTLSISADIMVSGENYEIHKGNRVIWGMGAGAAAVLTVDPASLVAGNTFAIQLECGESRIIGYDGTDFEKIGGIAIPLVCNVYHNLSTPIVITNATDTIISTLGLNADNSEQMQKTTGNGGINIIRSGDYNGQLRLAWTAANAVDHDIKSRLFVNGSNQDSVNSILFADDLSVPHIQMSYPQQLTTGDVCELYARHDAVAGGVAATVYSAAGSQPIRNWMSLLEVNPW